MAMTREDIIKILVQMDIQDVEGKASRLVAMLDNLESKYGSVGDQASGASEDIQRAFAEMAQEAHDKVVLIEQDLDGMLGHFENMGRQFRAAGDEMLDTWNEVGQQFAQMGRQGAQLRDMSESFDHLAERAGLSGDELVDAMQRAANGTVSANNIMQVSNMVLGANFETSVEDMAQMMEFARLKSKQFGLTTEAAFTRMSYGAVKAEVEFLDELGITIKLNDALEMTAERLGKTTGELSSQERSMAIWNALLQQADKQLEEFPDGVTKATDSYDQFGVSVQRVTNVVNNLIDQSGIGPFFSKFTNFLQMASTLFTPFILAKQAAATAAAAHAAALATENKALIAQTGAMGQNTVATKISAGLKGNLQYLSALKNVGGTGAMLGGLKELAVGAASAAAPFAALAAAIGGLVVMFKQVEKVSAEVRDGTEETKDQWSEYLESIREVGGEEQSAIAIAQDYAQKRRDVSAALYDSEGPLEDYRYWVARNHMDEESLVNAQEEEIQTLLQLSSQSYPEYIRAVQEANEELPKHAEAIGQASEAAWKYTQIVDEMGDSTAALVEWLEWKVENLSGVEKAFAKAQLAAASLKLEEEELIALQERSALGEEAVQLARGGLGDVDMDPEVLAAKQNALAVALGETSWEQVQARDTMEMLSEAYARGIITEQELVEYTEQAKEGIIELSNAERESIESTLETIRVMKDKGAAYEELTAAQEQEADIQRQMGAEVEQIERDTQDNITQIRQDALARRNQLSSDYQSQRAKNERAHRMRMEDIERAHRQRLRDIQRDYDITVRKAAIERNALAIIEAREARDEAVMDEEQNYSEQVRTESRNYAEQQRAAEEAYQQRLAALNQSLQEEVRREQEAANNQIEIKRQQYNQELADLQAYIAQYEAMIAQFNARMSARQTPVGATGYQRPGGYQMPTDAVQHGFSGVVTGPHAFVVEPGVREYVYASGALGGAASPAQMALPGTPTMAPQNVNVGGRVDVNVSGLGDQIGGKVADAAAAIIMNDLASVFEKA